ncbi:MAG: hypothetical protein K5679_12835 [Lachnospiraceae bacterium]|nr:hypothetical protein [Lachnospiraceae bacterium]
MKTRSNFKNFLFLMLHWLIADAVVLLGFLIQLSFPKDPEPEVMASLLGNKIYYLNIPLYIVGWVIILVGYFLVWKLWLSEDWKRFKGQPAGWIVGCIVLSLINHFIQFILFFLITYLRLPWGYYGGPYKWVGRSILLVLLILLIMPLWFFIRKEKEA